MKPDCIIIGAGIIGLSSAYELAVQGYRVTVIDRAAAGQESSWAGGGILSPLLPWMYTDPVNRLTDYSVSLYRDWVAQLQEQSGIDAQILPSGMLVLPEYDYAAARAHCRIWGRPLQRLPARDIVPDLTASPEALWLPQVCQVRNPRLLQALLAALRGRGVTLLENTEVTGLVRGAGGISSLETNRGSLSAQSYVVTGGAWSQGILGNLALQVQIRPMQGQMLLFKAAPGRLAHILLHGSTYIIPRADGHVLTGSTVEDVGFAKQPTSVARQLLHRQAAALLPWLAEAPLVQQWAGLRPGSPDSIPVIDRHPEVENLYINSGHFRYGVTMAPASARLLANRILGRPQPLDMAPYAWPS